MTNDSRTKTEKKNTENKPDTAKKSGLKKRLIGLVCVPLFLMGVLTMIFAYIMGYRTVSAEVEQGLKNMAQATLYAYDDIYDNDVYFTEIGGGKYALDESKSPYIPDGAFMNYLGDKSGTDITLLYYDIRLMTTLKGTEGEDLSGTVVSKKVVDEVREKGDAVFYDDVMVGSKNYYACYIPVIAEDGTFKGMVATGKPTSFVKTEVIKHITPLVLLAVLMMVIGAGVGSSEAKKLADVIEKEKNFLGQIAEGNLRANLDADILKRPDELGDMGKFTVHVQRFIRDMIERDTLTKLYTRRIGETRMRNTRLALIEDGVRFVVAMADIDHFKRFNDTYGHDCGDLVLQTVASVFNRKMMGKGYAVRWGGEEFIIIFEDMSFDNAYEHLKSIREAVINEVVEYKGELLSITMSFGIAPGTSDELDDIIKRTDKLLYIAKEGGRDRIVRYDDYEQIEAVESMMKEKEEATALAGEIAQENAKAASTAMSASSAQGVKTGLERMSDTQSSSEEDRLEAMMKNML